MKDGTEQNFKTELYGLTASDFPIGRHEWIVSDPNCGIVEGKRNMTLSICDFSREFTCYSGHCVELEKRCDERRDCHDGSDEKDCTLIMVPKGYQKTQPPMVNSFDSNEVQINTQVSVLSIDNIDTLDMVVGLTIQINVQWQDQRLRFYNPTINKSNTIPSGSVDKLWLPMENIMHENAIIGEVREDFKEVFIIPHLVEIMEVGKTKENRVFKGSKNLLQMIQRFQIKYNCLFDVKKFPFDKDLCNFTMSLKNHKHVKVKFRESGSIIYLGPNNVDQFTVEDIGTMTEATNESSKYIFSITLKRNFTNQLITTFLPTFILLLLAYSTLFINIEHSSDRLMVTVTSLLVFAALLDSINQDLPKTSYIKYVDIWFVLHIASIFLMIIYHIILDSKTDHGYAERDTVQPFDSMIATEMDSNDKKTCIKRINKENMNRTAIIIIPIIYICFYAIYFYNTI
jgi:hypothetical protein